ncbi:MAG TPA: potassium channel family protein [Solirubrobacterales bacterium]
MTDDAEASRERGGGVWRQGGHHFGFVLVLILASLVFLLAAPEEDWARLTAIALQGLTLLAALRASRVSALVLRLAVAVVGIAIASSIAAYVGFGFLGATAARSISVLLVALAPLAIARGVVIDFRQEGEVSLHTMFGVLCIYLLIGYVFAFVFGVVDSLGSTPFFAQRAAANSHNLLYFSFTTITTTGYGDLTAGSDVGRSLAVAEALIGQIYLVTVVAAIVGGLGGRRPA